MHEDAGRVLALRQVSDNVQSQLHALLGMPGYSAGSSMQSFTERVTGGNCNAESG